MSIVSKILRCAVCYHWMAHLALIVVNIEFAWNYARFNSNDYYFMRFTHLQKSLNYANKSLNYFAVDDSWIPVWPPLLYITSSQPITGSQPLWRHSCYVQRHCLTGTLEEPRSARFGKSTHISMISNSVTHLRSYTNLAIAYIAGNSAPISPVQCGKVILPTNIDISHMSAHLYR